MKRLNLAIFIFKKIFKMEARTRIERHTMLLVHWVEKKGRREGVMVKKMGPIEVVGYKGGLWLRLIVIDGIEITN